MGKITYKLKLKELIDTKGLKKNEKAKVKDEVGELLLDLVLKDVSNQRSSVSGTKWKGLSKEYKKQKSKVAPGIANLELTGAMLDALKVKKYRDGLEIGVFQGKDALKCENHNKFTARARKTALPKRQFIPKPGENYRPGIVKELRKIAKEVVDEDNS